MANLLIKLFREVRGNALWDLIKYSVIIAVALLITLGYRILAWVREIPQDRVIDVMIFITAFLLLSIAYALSRYHNRRAVSVSQFGRKVKASERIIENLSPGHLIGLTENLSEEEAYRVIEPYVGKWVEVSGSVKDTAITGKSFIMLINAKWTHHTIVAVFREQEWRTHVEDLKKGDRVRIAGQVEKANILGLYLENCEVVESKFGD